VLSPAEDGHCDLVSHHRELPQLAAPGPSH
jgi:hypothetical protein